MSFIRILISFQVILFILTSYTAHSQGFGRNKPKYKKFDFEVYQTTNFDIYHYFKNDQIRDRLAHQSEAWERYIMSITEDTIRFQNPLIFYTSHGDFQQTNTISGHIGVGTGGVTEAFKNRVIMPVTLSNQTTFQVLGHELVHAHQYNMIIRGDSTSIQSLANLPLYMVEGMAEYMTRGRIDPFTAMWMRDIVLHDKIPDLDKMANPQYFPYRYGQTFWAVMTGIYGDRVMRDYLRLTARLGMRDATAYLFRMDVDSLSSIWKNALTDHYLPHLRDQKEDPVGRLLLNDDNAGNINLSPALSPNGRYVIFLSEKGIFTTELFLADARTGKLI